MPGWMRLFINQRLIPRMIDALGGIEQAAEWVALRGRARPLPTVMVAFTAGALLAMLRRVRF